MLNKKAMTKSIYSKVMKVKAKKYFDKFSIFNCQALSGLWPLTHILITCQSLDQV